MQAMQGSTSEHSYARHSLCQNYNFHVLAKPRLREAIQHLVDRKPSLNPHVPHDAEAPACADATVIPRHHLAIADLGCSHGCNKLDYAEFVVPALINEDHDQNAMQEIQYFFSDLPSNDFNALFHSLERYLQHPGDSGTANSLPKFFAAGVPGSFYGRLFIKASLDLVICSYSLHWLSQVPPTLVDQTSPAWNGGQTWISDTEPSKKAIVAAYAQQSEMDKKRFRRCRAEELASGGILFLFWVTKSACKDAALAGESGCLPFEHTLQFLDQAWKEMVDEVYIIIPALDSSLV